MRSIGMYLVIVALAACSRREPNVIAGTWEREIHGAKFSVQIATNADGKYDLLTATVNGNRVYYQGRYGNRGFVGSDEDLSKLRPEEEPRSLYTLAEVNRDGDLVCMFLNASQIPHGTVLKKLK